MGDNRKIKPTSLYAQRSKLKNSFPDSEIKIEREVLTWKGWLRPTHLSRRYLVKIILTQKNVQIFVTEPDKLKLHSHAKRLPHVYNHKKQQLCLFYGRNEWNVRMMISDTIIPWASEWLYYYELWLFTGNWLGGGIEHGKKSSGEKAA